MQAMALEREISAYQRDLEELIKHFENKFVVYHDDARLGAFDSFENAATAAISTYGRGPYLIRQVLRKQPVIPMPASVAYRAIYATA